VTSTTEVADTTTEPVAIINGDPVTLVWPVPEIVIVPIPKNSGSAPDVSVTEVADIPTGPIVKTKLLPDMPTSTLLSVPTVEKGKLANVSNPKSINYKGEERYVEVPLRNNYISLYPKREDLNILSIELC
jgi:hypothetical protein